nr:tripartite tricarboxylate transporter substrate-binding protein [Rhodoferax sediminis]
MRSAAPWSPSRSGSVPAAGEVSKELVVTNWINFFAPPNTPKPVIDKINAALVKCVAREDVRAQFLKLLVTATSMPGPEAFQKFVASEYARYGSLVRERGIVIGE